MEKVRERLMKGRVKKDSRGKIKRKGYRQRGKKKGTKKEVPYRIPWSSVEVGDERPFAYIFF